MGLLKCYVSDVAVWRGVCPHVGRCAPNLGLLKCYVSDVAVWRGVYPHVGRCAPNMGLLKCNVSDVVCNSVSYMGLHESHHGIGWP